MRAPSPWGGAEKPQRAKYLLHYQPLPDDHLTGSPVDEPAAREPSRLPCEVQGTRLTERRSRPSRGMRRCRGRRVPWSAEGWLSLPHQRQSRLYQSRGGGGGSSGRSSSARVAGRSIGGQTRSSGRAAAERREAGWVEDGDRRGGWCPRRLLVVVGVAVARRGARRAAVSGSGSRGRGRSGREGSGSGASVRGGSPSAASPIA